MTPLHSIWYWCYAVRGPLTTFFGLLCSWNIFPQFSSSSVAIFPQCLLLALTPLLAFKCWECPRLYCDHVIDLFFFSFFKVNSTPDIRLKHTTSSSRVASSTNWASQVSYPLLLFKLHALPRWLKSMALNTSYTLYLCLCLYLPLELQTRVTVCQLDIPKWKSKGHVKYMSKQNFWFPHPNLFLLSFSNLGTTPWFI